MNDENNNPDDPGAEDEFGLAPPSGKMAHVPDGDRPPVEHSAVDRQPPRGGDGGDDYKKMGWKGFEDDEEDPDPDVTFSSKEDLIDEELDMTPMVDVTFLLLIFFIVTASFTLQKSIQTPQTQTDDPSTQVEEQEDEDQYVEVIIDQNNTYYVTSKDEEEVEAPSDREMRSQLKDKKSLTDAKRLIIRAHEDSMHKKVVTVWDAGIQVGMERIEIRTTDEDF